MAMAQDDSDFRLHHRDSNLLKDRLQFIKRNNSCRYEAVPIQASLTFEKGLYVVIRACQFLALNNDGIIFVGVAGPSGAGKTVFTDKILNVKPTTTIISMDNYNDASRIVDGNFDDPHLTDYDTLLQNINDLKAGKAAQVPIYDFKTSSCIGYRTVEAPSDRIVIIEGIYALSEKLRPFLDLRVSVTGGVHFDLVKRVLRDIQRAGQAPEEIIQQISETVYPMYKVFIEPDLETAHVKIKNKFNPFTGFENATFILKSLKTIPEDSIKAVLDEDLKESSEQIYDIYLLPPGEDPETCQSYLRMRNQDGKYNLMFEEVIIESPFIISPRICFEVSVRLLGGLMALGYTIAAILQRNSHVFSDSKVTVKIDWLEQLNRQYIQVQGKDCLHVRSIAKKLGLEGSYTPRTYIEQIQIEKLVNEVIALPEDLKTKLSLDDDLVSSPQEIISRAFADSNAWQRKNIKSGMSRSYSNQRDTDVSKFNGYDASSRRYDERNLESVETAGNKGVASHLSEQISTLNDRMDEFTSRIEELSSNLTIQKSSLSQQNIALQSETSYFRSGISSGSLTGSILPNGSSFSQLNKESPLIEELQGITRGQRKIMHQLDNLCNLFRENLGEARSRRVKKEGKRNIVADAEPFNIPVAATLSTIAFGGLGIALYKGFWTRN